MEAAYEISKLYYPWFTDGGTEVTVLKVAAPSDLIADKHADVLTPSLILFLLVYGPLQKLEI